MQFSDLDRDARGRLRTLTKDNAEGVGLHLVMAGRLIDTEPELAYEHAQAAVRRAGRVDIVREAAGLTAYSTGRFAEALRELRTARRLNGSSEHLAVMADCERGLGRPEAALALAASPEAETLDEVQKVELGIVVSGARVDLGETEAAEATLLGLGVPAGHRELELRVVEAHVALLQETGRETEIAALLAGLTSRERVLIGADSHSDEDDVVVFDLEGEQGADDDETSPEGGERTDSDVVEDDEDEVDE